jgi:tetratricopeptide (TPR) repeat protein
MSILSRIFRKREDDDYAAGVALFEQGRYVEAAGRLREFVAAEDRCSGPLADFYLRQSLVQEGRRLLAADDTDGAIACFGETADRWPKYPDMQFWHGIALASADRWDEALAAARAALRFNNDYIEARLLEAGCLLEIDQRQAAAESLNALLASGRRVEHPLIRFLADKGPYGPENLPQDLPAMLRGAIGEKRDDESVNVAVDLCRAGDWESGIDSLRTLCEANPTYPDYRVKLAGALFQTGRNSEALAEVGQAIVLNPRYRTAAHLKALILADQHRFAEAREVIRIQPELTDPVGGHPGEELFCSYLGAVVSLLTGRRREVREQLGLWGDLSATFPTAELLVAASDDLDGRDERAQRRFAVLADKWFLDEDYHYYRACHHARCGRWDRVAKVLEGWPPADDHAPRDERWQYLSALARLATGRSPQDAVAPPGCAGRPAWRLLAARALMAQERWLEALQILHALAGEGETTETLAGLIMQAYLAVDETGDAPMPEAKPDLLLRDRLCLLHRQERTPQALSLLRRHRELHPEDLRWTWLDPAFWLDPVRRWIG